MKRLISRESNRTAGSILIIVLVTLIFTAAALVTFLDKAQNDLLVESHRRSSDRLRLDAYSALNVTLAVLQDFYVTQNNSLHSSNEGWGDPLAWSGWSPADGNKIDISFQDESGKIPLINTKQTELNQMFLSWGMTQDNAEKLTDALLSWMKKNYVPQMGLSPDYPSMTLPYDAPLRSLRSYNELAAIDFAKDILYDENGQPNAYWWQFVNDFSLFNYKQPNINALNNDVLIGLGQFDANSIQNMANYMAGTGSYKVTTPLGVQWFDTTTAIRTVAGPIGQANQFTTTISALRVLITVHEGSTTYHLSAVIAPKNGATTVVTTATDVRKGTSSSTSGETSTSTGLSRSSTSGPSAASPTPTGSQTGTAATRSNIMFPFTVLEILENDAILNPPPPPPPPPSSI
jgi:general secretion pathway protein K